MKKFWNFIRDEDGERVLRLEGPIDEDSFWGDVVTPKAFREELEAEEGDLTVWINSPGGSVFAAAEIYTMLCDHKGKITVKVASIAASAASVVAMAGDRVLMSPTALLMIHDPMTIAMGNTSDMEKAISTLNEVKESIINAYAKKTGLSRNKIAKLMSDETWLNAKKAVELGFADEILFTKAKEPEEGSTDETEVRAGINDWQPFSTKIMGQTILNRLGCTCETGRAPDSKADSASPAEEEPEQSVTDEPGTPVDAGTGLTDAEPRRTRRDDDPDEGDGPDEDDDPDEPDADDPDDDPDDPDDDPDEDDPQKKRRTANKTAEDGLPEEPVIGMDGKTKDGAMPYELLMKQLDYLK